MINVIYALLRCQTRTLSKQMFGALGLQQPLGAVLIATPETRVVVAIIGEPA